MESEYEYTPNFSVTDSIKSDFDNNGYILVRGLLDKDEIMKLTTALENDEGIQTKAFSVDVVNDKQRKMCMWNHPGNDLTGILARCDKVLTTTERLLGGEVYHYHTKLMMKEADGGGQVLWHQDYGYWYNNGCMYPDMATVFIAIDSCKQSNGCLQVIPRSHKFGRIDHKQFSGQLGGDMERINHILTRNTPQFVEMQPGDALFFHCNLLHKSHENNSPDRRWAFLMAYNRASNNPVKKHQHPRYVKMEKVPNSALKECDTTTDLRNKGFIRKYPEGGGVKVVVEDDHLN